MKSRPLLEMLSPWHRGSMRSWLHPLSWSGLIVCLHAGRAARVALQLGGGDGSDLGGDCEVPVLALVRARAGRWHAGT